MDERRTLLVLALAALAVLLAWFASARPDGELPKCACGHDAEAHRHFTNGGRYTWCALCKPWNTDEPCLRYDPVPCPSWHDPRGEAESAEFLRRLALAVRERPVAAT